MLIKTTPSSPHSPFFKVLFKTIQLGKLYPVSPQHLFNILMVFVIFAADIKSYAGGGGALSEWPGLVRCLPQRLAAHTTWTGRVDPQRRARVHLPDEGQPDAGQRETTDADERSLGPGRLSACPGGAGRGIRFCGSPRRQPEDRSSQSWVLALLCPSTPCRVWGARRHSECYLSN